jgi:hypothetical protein
MLSQLGAACRLSVFLLIFFGLFGHNMLRFTWLWLAAFALLSRGFCDAKCDDDRDSFD